MDPRTAQLALVPLLVATVVSITVGCDRDPQPRTAETGSLPLAHVGSATCAECHAAEAEAWRGSHHDLAMQEATPETVLGDFHDSTFTYAGVTSTFSRDGDRFLVETDGATGELETFEVAWTFGVEPLQQYLVPLPDGRVQALSIAWDTRPAEDGGQRWYHLYPDEAVDHEDPLHWTGIYQNWNFMCAECHSTGLRRRYDSASDSFATTWEEIDVACEACHGQGSRHVAWARAAKRGDPVDRPASLALPVRFEHDEGDWSFADDGIARRSTPRVSETELRTCARCHSRRSPLVEEEPRGRSLLQTHLPSLLAADLYFPDGQILDEVYVWGSFLQSRMHAAGVTCGDCHDPHSLELRTGGAPDTLCARCHDSAVFADPAHHRHPAESAGASCVACHMPSRTYMGIDARRDHSFRIPRPDLGEALGTPDPCSGCHRERSVEWAAERFAERYPGPRPAHWGEALARSRAAEPGAIDGLIDLLGDGGSPAIVRATAAADLGTLGDRRAIPTLEGALRDPEPLVRLGALSGSEPLLPLGGVDLVRTVGVALDDPQRAVRLEAARILIGAPATTLQTSQAKRLEMVLDELLASRLTFSDRPEAQAQLALIARYRGDPDGGEDHLLRALAIAPRFRAGLATLADLYREEGRDPEAEVLLRRGIELLPDDPDLLHALGLNLVRQGRRGAALEPLRRAADLAGSSRYGYVYAVALQSVGRVREAIERLRGLLGRGDPRVAEALVHYCRQVGDQACAEQALRALRTGSAGR